MSDNGNDIERKLMGVLSDPSAMASIMSLVKSLGGNQGQSEPNTPVKEDAEPSVPTIANVAPVESKTAELQAVNTFGQFHHNDEFNNKSLGLLLAIKPFLIHERAEKLETVTQILKVLSLTEIFK